MIRGFLDRLYLYAGYLAGLFMLAIFVLMIFLGAMITGWHYLIDLIAGMLLAWIVWAWTARRYGVIRFTRLSPIS